MKNKPGFPANRSDRIEVIGFGMSNGAEIIDGCCDDRDVTVTFGGDVINVSRNGVTFLRRPRFLDGDSNTLSGGLPNSDGSNNRVFCTSKTVDGIIGSWFDEMPRTLALWCIDGNGRCCCC